MVFSIFTVTLPHAAAGGAARSCGQMLDIYDILDTVS